jgi:hypothetical protein
MQEGSTLEDSRAALQLRGTAAELLVEARNIGAAIPSIS